MCNKSASHQQHSGYLDQHGYIDWVNEEYVPPPAKPGAHGALLKQLTAQVPRPMVRKDDPPTAHQAISSYQPNLKTRKGAVAQYLIRHLGQWIDAPTFAHEDVGGFAGTRRLRELREDHGWPISTREKPGHPNLWQHRLDEMPEAGDR
jgi:hypothetical protein